MNLANRITILRILLAPLFLGALIYLSPERSYLQTLSILVFLLACTTDAMDGYLARRLDQKTVLGSYIDPLADKLLLLSGFLALSFMSHLPASMHIPAWTTIVVITRDVVILIGSIVIFLTTGRLKPQPLRIGKATTVSQMCTLLVSLLSAPVLIQRSFCVMTVVLTVASGLAYIKIGGRLMQPS